MRFAARLTPPPLYHCQYADSKPKIDGSLQDEVWQKTEAITQFRDIRGGSDPRLQLPLEVRMLWNRECFYVAARLVEPDVRAKLGNRDDIVWKDNDFEVFIDPDGDGVNYFELEFNALGTLLDLMMNHPYRSGGQFFSTWDCPGLQWAVQVQGTLNDSTDTDEGWTVEMAIPHKALSVSFDDALKQGRIWRVNFSRVQWPHGSTQEENWVWAPTGLVNIHMPERWAYVFLTGDPLQPRNQQEPSLNYDTQVYRFLWLLFYAQQEHWEQHRRYITSVEGYHLTAADSAMVYLPDPQPLNPLQLPPATTTEISTHATPHGFEVSVKRGNLIYLLDHLGHFRLLRVEDAASLPIGL